MPLKRNFFINLKLLFLQSIEVSFPMGVLRYAIVIIHVLPVRQEHEF